jgi:hypothetical protein
LDEDDIAPCPFQTRKRKSLDHKINHSSYLWSKETNSFVAKFPFEEERAIIRCINQSILFQQKIKLWI